MPDRYSVQFPSGHIVTFPEGTPEKEVGRQAAHIHYFSLSKMHKPVTPQLDTDKPQQDITGQVIPERHMENAPVTGTRPPISSAPNPNAPQMDIRNAHIPGLQGLETDVEPRLQ
jgi:hypothetical protein